MEHIKACIRGNVLGEATVSPDHIVCVVSGVLTSSLQAVRTRNAITIISRYPTRHVQIVLRLYRNISEILTRFDVDCAGVAFNGSQVWATPRALAAFMTQVNTVDFTRCSPLYENRLAKYAKRGFEVLWQGFDRSKIDRTIFDRDASQVVGLARLLVLEKGWIERNGRSGSGVDSSSHRDRRAGVCDGEDSSETSNYEFICIPYGPGYDATRVRNQLPLHIVLRIDNVCRLQNGSRGSNAASTGRAQGCRRQSCIVTHVSSDPSRMLCWIVAVRVRTLRQRLTWPWKPKTQGDTYPERCGF